MTKKLTRPNYVVALVIAIMMLFAIGAGAADDDTVYLSFTAWGEFSHILTYEEIARAFNDSQDRIFIEFIPDTGDYTAQMKNNIIAGVGPDVYFTQEMETVGLVDEGWFLPLNGYIERDADFVRQIHPHLFESFTWEGNIGSFPVVTFVSLLFYNPVLFNEAGLATPTAMTWDDLRDNAQLLTRRSADGMPTQYGHRVEYFPNFNLYYLWQAGGGILDESRRHSLLDSRETLEAVQFIRDLAWEYEVVPKPFEMGEFILERHNLGMFTHGSWMIGYYKNLFGFDDFDVLPPPSHRETVSMAYPNGFAIAASTPHPDEAWEFIKFVAGVEGQKIIAESDLGIPVSMHPDVADAYMSGTTAEQRRVALETIVDARAPRVVPGMQLDIIEWTLAPLLAPVWDNLESPENALEEAHRLVQAQLDEMFSDR